MLLVYSSILLWFDNIPFLIGNVVWTTRRKVILFDYIIIVCPRYHWWEKLLPLQPQPTFVLQLTSLSTYQVHSRGCPLSTGGIVAWRIPHEGSVAPSISYRRRMFLDQGQYKQKRSVALCDVYLGEATQNESSSKRITLHWSWQDWWSRVAVLEESHQRQIRSRICWDGTSASYRRQIYRRQTLPRAGLVPPVLSMACGDSYHRQTLPLHPTPSVAWVDGVVRVKVEQDWWSPHSQERSTEA
jgi:hypothetical protein